MSEFKTDFVVQRSGSEVVDYDILALNLWAQWGNDLEAVLISKLLILMSMSVGFSLIFQRKYFLEKEPTCAWSQYYVNKEKDICLVSSLLAQSKRVMFTGRGKSGLRFFF